MPVVGIGRRVPSVQRDPEDGGQLQLGHGREVGGPAPEDVPRGPVRAFRCTGPMRWGANGAGALVLMATEYSPHSCPVTPPSL
jgi:hypothetical protein